MNQKIVRHQRQKNIEAEGDEEKGDADQQTVQHRDQKVFWHDEVRKGENCAGVIVGRENDLRRLPISGHQVAVVENFGLFYPELRKMGLHEPDKRQFLLFCFSHLIV